MTLPDDRRKGSARERFRNILSAEQADEPPPEPRKPAIVNLPRVGEGGPPVSRGQLRGRDPEMATSESSAGQQLLRTFWTVGGILSVIANAVLLSMVFGGGRAASVSSVLPGIYAGLEQLDNAHLQSTIPVQASLALDTTVPVKTATRITLARDLSVRGAHVTINSAGLSIDSPADITLPAGTEMDVNLDLVLPLQSALPMTADVPVDIVIRDTEVHTAIQKMKDSLRPWVCANAPAALLSDGTPICR